MNSIQEIYDLKANPFSHVTHLSIVPQVPSIRSGGLHQDRCHHRHENTRKIKQGAHYPADCKTNYSHRISFGFLHYLFQIN